MRRLQKMKQNVLQRITKMSTHEQQTILRQIITKSTNARGKLNILYILNEMKCFLTSTLDQMDFTSFFKFLDFFKNMFLPFVSLFSIVGKDC